MNGNGFLDSKSFARLAWRLLLIGGVGAPIVFATAFTLPLSLFAAFGGEGIVAALLYFPVGWGVSILFAGLPGIVVALVLLAYRYFVGPWTSKRLVTIIWPTCFVLAALFLMYMGGSNQVGEIMAALAGSFFYAGLFMAIILFFWSMRERLGLTELAK